MTGSLTGCLKQKSRCNFCAKLKTGSFLNSGGGAKTTFKKTPGAEAIQSWIAKTLNCYFTS